MRIGLAALLLAQIARLSNVYATTVTPSEAPALFNYSLVPSIAPSMTPTTHKPSHKPTRKPTTFKPSHKPTHQPTTHKPTHQPSESPSSAPSTAPSVAPTRSPWNPNILHLQISPEIILKNHDVKIEMTFPNGCNGSLTILPNKISTIDLTKCSPCDVGKSIAPSSAPTHEEHTKKPTKHVPTHQHTKKPVHPVTTEAPTPEPTKPLPTHAPQHPRSTKEPTRPTKRATKRPTKPKPPTTPAPTCPPDEPLAIHLQHVGVLAKSVGVEFINGCTGILNIAPTGTSAVLDLNHCQPCAPTAAPVPTMPTHKPTDKPTRHHPTRMPTTAAPTTTKPTTKPTKRPEHTRAPTDPTRKPTHRKITAKPTPKPTCGCMDDILANNGTNRMLLFSNHTHTKQAAENKTAVNTHLRKEMRIRNT